ncbi:hypothetical protein CORC01_10418 [Colletotrichum orchidophilum]|uniref:Uncharacterized protein n=1 Tax=Colletotrichum orchidophilum TaxID=1209926 RepID=A0A1G4AYL4_9PEZI|nr:uncharacterized protein CORC01_10418 [Colletotrichum orchidophilum]OHE94258.1 hypothetical protein CORC01_10418 [Colletotrichum orchidophilum]
MPPQTRSGGRAPADPSPDRVYKSSKPAKQAKFPHRRTEVRTYSSRKPTARVANHQQKTLTQMFETTRSSPVRLDLSDDDEETMPRKRRRKTTGDEPTPSSSFHTQTLTQMSRRSSEKSAGEEEDDLWQFQPSDDEAEKIPPMLRSASDKENQAPGKKQLSNPPSRTPSVVPQTPTNKRAISEIPSSIGSPLTPMLARYSPAPKRSPLKDKSTNTMSPIPKLTASVKRPRTLTVQDSYATTGSQGSSQFISPSKMPLQPTKNVRFITPHPTASLAPMEEEEDDEGEREISPSPHRPQRSPLCEIADSEDELDDLEILDEEDEEYDAVGEDVQFQMDQIPASSEEKAASKEASPVEEGDSDKENVAPSARESEEEEAEDATVVLSKPFVFAKLGRQDSDRRETVEVITSSPEPTHNSGSSVLQIANRETNDESVSQTTPTQSPKTPKAKGKAAVETPKTPHTQGLESQRLPFDVIRGMGRQGDRTDIFISIHPEHMEAIVAGDKNHEFRNYKIPHTVTRMWLYITKPVAEVRYMACFSEARSPGEIDEDGVGNAEFNQNQTSKFAYHLRKVYQLNDPMPLQEMIELDWLHGPPQKYNYVPPAVVGQLMANLRCCIVGNDKEEDDDAVPDPEMGRKESSPVTIEPSEERTVSQELAEQLRSDIEHSTQHHSSDADLLVPSSQTPTKNRGRKFGTELPHFTKPAPPPTPFNRPPNPTPRRAVRPSQATTVSQTSSPSQSPVKSAPRRPTHANNSSLPIFVDDEDEDDSPVRLSVGTFQMDSSQLLSKSQMLPESLLRDDDDDDIIVFDSDQDDEL